MSLHERIAKALGWTVRETQSFSLPALRDAVRGTHPGLAAELDETIRRGDHVRGTPHDKAVQRLSDAVQSGDVKRVEAAEKKLLTVRSHIERVYADGSGAPAVLTVKGWMFSLDYLGDVKLQLVTDSPSRKPPTWAADWARKTYLEELKSKVTSAWFALNHAMYGAP